MREPKAGNPIARKRDLVVQELPGELLVYDLKTHTAHCLNETAYRVWTLCDGRASIAEITANLSRHFGKELEPDVVWLALKELERVGLLEEYGRKPDFSPDRREVLRKLAQAAVVLPVVSSILAPRASIAQSVCSSALCRNSTQIGSAANCGACANVLGTCFRATTCVGTSTFATTCQACTSNFTSGNAVWRM
ncbi:PqqD family protein [bacterium CPR1]|nr:PqqD family protein [bacterium CPR1]